MSDLYSNKEDNKNFLHSLSFHISSEIPQASIQRLIIKNFFPNQRYADLDLFRKQIEQGRAGLHHQPFTLNKRNTAFYKGVFLGFSAFFFSLDIVVMTAPLALNCGFFGACTMLKGALISLCTILSLSALTLGLRLKPEKEAIAFYIRKTKARIAAIYERKKIHAGIKSIFAFIGPNKHKAAVLKQMYDETIDKIHDINEEALHLSQRIVTAKTLNELEKEDLLNQALEELQEKLQYCIHTFTQSKDKVE